MIPGDTKGITTLCQNAPEFSPGTISMPTGRHVDNDFIPGLKTKTDF